MQKTKFLYLSTEWVVPKLWNIVHSSNEKVNFLLIKKTHYIWLEHIQKEKNLLNHEITNMVLILLYLTFLKYNRKNQKNIRRINSFQAITLILLRNMQTKWRMRMMKIIAIKSLEDRVSCHKEQDNKWPNKNC